jgi:hypothetical protein
VAQVPAAPGNAAPPAAVGDDDFPHIEPAAPLAEKVEPPQVKRSIKLDL